MTPRRRTTLSAAHRAVPPRRAGLVVALAAGSLGAAVLGACSSEASRTAVAPVVVETTAAPTTTVAPTTTTEAPTTTSSTTTTEVPITSTTEVERVRRARPALVAVGDADGDETARVQQRLADLGFWVGPVDGLYGVATEQAVMAFQKYLGLERTGEVDETTAAYLTEFKERARGSADSGTLIEVDKTQQLAFLIVDGRTEWTFNTSTGSETPYRARNKQEPWKIETGDSVTPNGVFVIDRQREDGWWEGDLGKIYRPKYFIGGIALHGMTSVPGYAASHGCVRLSLPVMDFLWDLGYVNEGFAVWVHGDSSPET